MLVLIVPAAFAQLQITSALCENKINPAGVALQNIRFGWELGSIENNQFQTAYRLVMASSKDKLTAGNYDVYNSDIVKSRQTVLVEYRGNPLQANVFLEASGVGQK